MFFAIPASGSCEVTDERPQLGHWLRQGVEFVAAGEEGLLRATEDLLRDEPRRARIAEAGRNAARSHTFAARAALIVDLVTRSRTRGGSTKAESGRGGGERE
jgi:spore maturation protein CgeB